MNKFRLVGLAVALAVGMSFASGTLWNYNAPYGIVQFDWIIDCMNGPDFDETDENDPCYKNHGGWWFGYVAGANSSGPLADETLCGPESYKSGVNKVMAKINGADVSFVGPDYNNCQGPPITDMTDGSSWLLDGTLDLSLEIGEGLGSPDYEPAIAAFAVNFSQPPQPGKSPPIDRDFSAKSGFCITYRSNHTNSLAGTSGSNFAVELGWDEDNAREPGGDVAYDTWYYVIPDGNGQIQKLDLPFNGFEQEAWATNPWPLDKAVKQMRSLKFRLKGYTPATAHFELIQLGWHGECTAEIPGGFVPIVSGGVTNPVNFNMVGRIVNMSVAKPTAVQVINLQGKVVYSQTLTPANQKMNLSNLPMGVYMLRAPALGYTNKIVINK